MKKSDFENSPSGDVIKTEYDHWAFVPNPLPPKDIDLAKIAGKLEQTSRLIGELNGIASTLPNPYLLISPLQTREALSSSSMEGTYSTADDVLLVEAGGHVPDRMDETREVVNYRAALSEAISSLEDVPLSLRTIRNAHRTLMRDVGRQRGSNANPGEFKTSQNFIGAARIEDARFIPPPPLQAKQAMHQLEKFFHDENRERLPDLVKSALIHYQFEAVHPFGDGNGRVGRMLITIDLYTRGVIKSPILYLSPSLEKRRDEYIDLMFEVSRSGAWIEWVAFFLDIVSDACNRSITTFRKLYDLQHNYQERVREVGRSANLLKASDNLFVSPVVSIPALQEYLGVTYRAAQLIMEKMVEALVLTELEETSHPKFFASFEIIDIIREGADPAPN